MFVIYNFFLFLLILISPLIVLIRIFLGKEDQNRFKEKYGFFPKNNKADEIIWIHGASVGEILSIITIVRRFEEDKKIKRILITSSTTSSSNILSKFKLTIVPVCDDQKNYKGSISGKKLLDIFCAQSGFSSSGSVIVILVNNIDYQLSQISQIENAVALAT